MPCSASFFLTSFTLHYFVLLVQLERLYLTMNKISVLPEEIGFCSRLSELDLSANAIDSLPTSLAMCNQMVILNVAMNKISDIPPDIFSLLVQLRELQL